MPYFIPTCEAYIQGDDEYFINSTFENPKKWVGLDKKYANFKQYETAIFVRNSHCGDSTHLLIGLSNNNGLRTCHIAYEEFNGGYNRLYSDSRWAGSKYSSENRSYHLMAYVLDEVESEFGQRTTITSTYCSHDKPNSSFVKTAVSAPDHPDASNKVVGKGRTRPLQHLVFTNAACDIPTE